MFTRHIDSVRGTPLDVEWGNGTSLRLLTAVDRMGFTVCHTTVRKGTRSRLHYKNHLEACYCLSGTGQVEDVERGVIHRLIPGTLYVLDSHDDHFLAADSGQDMVLLSVFNPPLQGTEKHTLNGEVGSNY